MSGSAAKSPRAFLSYSYDGPEHRAWVMSLATRLREDGVKAILDKWELEPGDSLPEFMEKAVRENDFVLIICTRRYKERSDRRIGGVGYEESIMTAEVFTERNQRKFKPVLRFGEWDEAAPTWVRGKVYVDLRGEPYSEEQYQELLQSLLRTRPKAPTVRPAVAPRNSAVATARQRTREDHPETPLVEPQSSSQSTHYGVPGLRPQDFFPTGVVPPEALVPRSSPEEASVPKPRPVAHVAADTVASHGATAPVHSTGRGRFMRSTQSVSGHHNVVAGHDVNINKREVTRVSVTPGPEHITEDQAKRLKELVDKIAKIEIDRGSDASKVYPRLWSALTNRYQVTSYHLIPSRLGDDAIKWLQQQAAMRRPKLRRANPSAWRGEHYAAIWARARELGMSKGEVYYLVKARLGLQVISLKQLGEQNLKRLYNIMMALDRKPEP